MPPLFSILHPTITIQPLASIHPHSHAHKHPPIHTRWYRYEYVPGALPLGRLVQPEVCGPVAEARPLFRHWAGELAREIGLEALCSRQFHPTAPFPFYHAPLLLEREGPVNLPPPPPLTHTGAFADIEAQSTSSLDTDKLGLHNVCVDKGRAAFSLPPFLAAAIFTSLSPFLFSIHSILLLS